MTNWTDTSRNDFDADAPQIQDTLFPAPDPVGTADMFDEE
jgi:hypothetical protein